MRQTRDMACDNPAFDLNGPANDLDVPAQYSQTDITFESGKTMIRAHVQAMNLQGID